MGSRVGRPCPDGCRLRQGSRSVPCISSRRRTSSSRINLRTPSQEKLALKRAIATANEQITDIYDQVSKQSGKGQAAIFRAHLALLNDAEIFQEVSTRTLMPATVRLGRGNMPLNVVRWS